MIVTDRLHPCDACHERRRTWVVEKPKPADSEAFDAWRICLACLLTVVHKAPYYGDRRG